MMKKEEKMSESMKKDLTIGNLIVYGDKAYKGKKG